MILVRVDRKAATIYYRKTQPMIPYHQHNRTNARKPTKTMNEENHSGDADSLKVIEFRPLITPRLILRQFKSKDAEAMMAWTSDEEALRYFTRPKCTSVEDAQASAISYREQIVYPNLKWCIVEEETKVPIGEVFVHFDEYAPSAEIAYILAKNKWGCGYATETVNEIERFLFNNGVNRCELRINTNNIASIRVAEKTGHHLDGVLRQYQIDRLGLFENIAVYSRLASDSS